MPNNASDETIFVPCAKCHGEGYIDIYANIANGVCFTCAGSKGRTTTVTAEAKRAAARAKRQAATAAKRKASMDAYAAAGDARWAGFAAAHPIEAAGILAASEAHPGQVGAELLCYVRCGDYGFAHAAAEYANLAG